MPVTKHNYIVKDVEKLADTIREAFQIAQSGRKGPVLVDITKDAVSYTHLDEELAKRKEKWQPREPKITDGYLRRYAALVTSGNRGAVLDVDQLK